MLRSRRLRPGRCQTSPSRISCWYFSSAGATARTSSRSLTESACAGADASTDSDASVRAKNFMAGLLSVLQFVPWRAEQPPCDRGRAEHNDRAGQQYRVEARAAREQPEQRAGYSQSQIEKRRVGAHGEAMLSLRRAPNCFDAETRIDQR